MSIWRTCDNLATVTLTGADLCKSLTVINELEIKLYNLSWENELSVRFQCFARDVIKIQRISLKLGDHFEILKKPLCTLAMIRLKRRWCMLIGSMMIMLLTLLLPTRILFFRIEGNERISNGQILEAAWNCGIRFGIPRREIRSEKMKNALISEIPELKWAGINTYGCMAVISVRESDLQTEQAQGYRVGSIISARDGYVTSCPVTKGSALCKPGEIVRAGQVLISGYNDCGICIRMTGAEGEIFANTTHRIHTVMPSRSIMRTLPRKTEKKISLIVGKKRIKLWKDSGISDTTCDRIYEEYYITLPGGFCLPFCVAVETITRWACKETDCPTDAVKDDMKKFAHDSVILRMVSGEILEQDHFIALGNGSIELSSVFLCTEMIGRTITEEIGEINGKAN